MSDSESDPGVVFYSKTHNRFLLNWYPLVAVCVGSSIYLLISFLDMANRSRDYSGLAFIPLWICVMIYDLMYFHRMLQKTRLILSNWGIEYFEVSFQLRSKWDDINLGKNRNLFTLFTPVNLTSKDPIIKRNPWFDWSSDPFHLMGNTRFFIPLRRGSWDRYDELLELIKKHRPDLNFEKK
jgi:hypothetical protein